MTPKLTFFTLYLPSVISPPAVWPFPSAGIKPILPLVSGCLSTVTVPVTSAVLSPWQPTSDSTVPRKAIQATACAKRMSFLLTKLETVRLEIADGFPAVHGAKRLPGRQVDRVRNE